MILITGPIKYGYFVSRLNFIEDLFFCIFNLLNPTVLKMAHVELSIYPVLLLMVLFSAASCRVQSSTHVVTKHDCNEYVTSMPDSVYCDFSSDSTYILCQDEKIHESASIFPDRINSIFIIRCDDGMMLFHENTRGGTAHWNDYENVELFYPSGIPRDASELTYVFNVISGKKYKSALKIR
jgi:hypothetical protein